ncbi:DUF5947 family protein [Pseudofrankia sp. BMG5.37]|uniref:DUF5947 family protein n=1 Tax=Pseudofrankia sp. BMG5.37 TaxID=3050035 RepID=UPI002895FD21|nr:DUF5947 family protein [Pseudofrankia sp. BMG5.37]MDT3444406.1 DUF5947 family protein [Pseudofrankia sp. BMG5.37]
MIADAGPGVLGHRATAAGDGPTRGRAQGGPDAAAGLGTRAGTRPGAGAAAALDLGTTGGALRRTVRRAGRAGARGTAASERCGLCAAPVPESHRHLLDEREAGLLCVCQACTLLFERDAAGRGHYVLVPRRRLALPGFVSGTLGIPVGLAFFVTQADGRIIARYPSPIGVTQGEIDQAVWAQAQERCGALGTLRPLVEAVLVNTAKGANEHWIVPIDLCYRLVAIVREEWKGFSGGSTVWPAINEFFAVLADGAVTARAAHAKQDSGPAPRVTHPPRHDTSVQTSVTSVQADAANASAGTGT